jgi:hypothetical protein
MFNDTGIYRHTLYANGPLWLHRGFLAVGALRHSCSNLRNTTFCAILVVISETQPFDRGNELKTYINHVKCYNHSLVSPNLDFLAMF